MSVLFPISLFFISGFLILKFLLNNIRIGFIARLALSWCFGTLGIAFQLYIYYLIGIRWDIAYIVIPWIVFALLLLGSSALKFPSFNFTIKPNLVFSISIFFYITIFILTLMEATLHPINSWDAVASWYFAGKAFYVDGGLSTSFINYANNSTPPLFNFIVTFVYLGIGEVNDTLVSAIYPIYLVFGGILIYEISKKFLKTKLALLLSILYITTPNLIRHGGRYDVGYADLPLGFYILATIYLLQLFLKFKKIRILIGLVFVSSLAALVRSEGTLFFILVTLCIFPFLLKSKMKAGILIILLGYVLILSWFLQVFILNYPVNPFIQHLPDFKRLPIVLFEFFKEMLNVQRWNLLWITFLVSLSFLVRFTKSYFEKVLLILIPGQLLVYLMVYLMTPVDVVSHINNSLDRLYIHVAGIGILIVGVLMSKLFKKNVRS